MDVHDNLVPSLSDECHGVDEKVTSNCLDDVLDELAAVRFQPHHQAIDAGPQYHCQKGPSNPASAARSQSAPQSCSRRVEIPEKL